MPNSASYAESCKLAFIEDLKQYPHTTYLQVADAILFSQPRHSADDKNILVYVDCWTGKQQYATFETEEELTRVMGEFLTNSDGPTEEFVKLFPAEFKED